MLKLKPATKRTVEKWRIRGRAGRNPNFEEIWAIIADFCEKLEIFPKNFHHFHTLFEREKSFYLQRPQPHPSARADSSRGDKNQRIPPRQYSAKKRMARQQSDELEKTKTRAAGHGPATPPTPTFERATPKGLRTHSPLRQGRKHTRRAPACRSSRSRERTVPFAAAGRHLRKIEQNEQKRSDKLKCFGSKRRQNDLADTLEVKTLNQ